MAFSHPALAERQKADGGRQKMVVAETVKNKELADLSFFETTGFSMWPFLRPGEKFLIKKTPTENLKVGDIIIYRADNQLVCHRLIKKIKQRERYLLYVRGDSSVSWPEPITEEMFLGKAISIIKNGKIITLNQMKRQLINRLIVLVAPLVSWGIKIAKILLGKK